MRTRLNANTDFFVSPNGNDGNDGSLASPWKTLTGAYNNLRDDYDFAGKRAKVNIAAGVYAPLTASGPCTGQARADDLLFEGNVLDCWAQEINAVNACAVGVFEGARLKLRGCTGKASGAVPNGFGALVGVGHLILGTSMWANCQNGFIDTGHGTINIEEAQGFWGASNCAMVAEAGGRIFGIGINYYIYQAPNFTGAYLLCDQNALIDVSGAVYHQVNGAASGLAANCSANGTIIKTGSTLPGSGYAQSHGGQIL